MVTFTLRSSDLAFYNAESRLVTVSGTRLAVTQSADEAFVLKGTSAPGKPLRWSVG